MAAQSECAQHFRKTATARFTLSPRKSRLRSRCHGKGHCRSTPRDIEVDISRHTSACRPSTIKVHTCGKVVSAAVVDTRVQDSRLLWYPDQQSEHVETRDVYRYTGAIGEQWRHRPGVRRCRKSLDIESPSTRPQGHRRERISRTRGRLYIRTRARTWQREQ